jgi:glycosyltransferase involved in cell wall biosynthesis
MKILFLLAHHPLPIHGAFGRELRAQRLIEDTVEAGHEIFVLQSPSANVKSREYFARIASERLHPLVFNYAPSIPFGTIIPRIESLFSFYLSDNRILRIAKSLQIDIIHSYYPVRVDSPRFLIDTMITPNWVQQAFLSGQWLGAIENYPHSFLLRSSFRKAARVIVEGTDSKADLIARYSIPSSRISIVPPGFDKALIESIRASTPRRPPTARVISFLGRLQKEKGIVELLKAFVKVRRTFPDARLKIIGDGNLRRQVSVYLSKHGLRDNVLLKGYLEHDLALREVADSDVFVLPSHVESFGIALIEAMALGRPVVATRVGPVPHDIIPDKKYGKIVSPADVNGIARSVVEYFEHPDVALETGNKGAEFVSKFSWEATAQKTFEVYRDIFKHISDESISRP